MEIEEVDMKDVVEGIRIGLGEWLEKAYMKLRNGTWVMGWLKQRESESEVPWCREADEVELINDTINKSCFILLLSILLLTQEHYQIR